MHLYKEFFPHEVTFIENRPVYCLIPIDSGWYVHPRIDFRPCRSRCRLRRDRVIGGSGLPPEELSADIRKAKAATKGVVAVNIMYAMKDFYQLVVSSIDAGIDMIITGAGFFP